MAEGDVGVGGASWWLGQYCPRVFAERPLFHPSTQGCCLSRAFTTGGCMCCDSSSAAILLQVHRGYVVGSPGVSGTGG